MIINKDHDIHTSIQSNPETGIFIAIHQDVPFFELDDYKDHIKESFQIEHDSDKSTVKIKLTFSQTNAVELKNNFASLMGKLNQLSSLTRFYLDRTHFFNAQCKNFSEQFNPQITTQNNHSKQNSYHSESNQFAY